MPGLPRVCFVVESNVWGGAERYLTTLIRELCDDIASSIVALGTPPSQLLEELAGLAPVTALPSVRHKADVRRLWALVRALAGTRSDLIHVNCATITNNRFGVAAAVLNRAPVVSTVHFPTVELHPSQKVTLRALYGGISAVIAVSDEVSRVVQAGCRVPAERVQVVLNGVSLPAAVPPRRLTGAPAVIGGMGRLVAHKGFDVLLEAQRELHGRGLVTRLSIAGVGPEIDLLRELADGLDVAWEGQVGDTAAWLDTLDVFCLPSRAEGLPLALLEAMARGLPCVATEVGQVRCAVGDGAVLVPPGDPVALAGALERLLEDPGLMRSHGVRARQAVQEGLTAAHMARSTLSVYTSVLKPSSDLTRARAAPRRRRAGRP